MRYHHATRALAASGILIALSACSAYDQDSSEPVRKVEQALESSYQVSLEFPGGFDESNVALHATSSLTVSDGITIASDGGVPAAAVSVAGPLELGADTRVGTVLSGADLTMRSRAQVSGDAQAAGSIVEQTDVVVSGSRLPNTPVGPLSTLNLGVEFPPASSGFNVEPDQTDTLAPGAYTSVAVKSRAQLTLSAGEYYLDDFRVEPDATLSLDTSGGPIVIYVRGSFGFKGGTATSGPDSSFLLSYLGTNPVSIEGSFDGTVVAPSATLRLGASPSGFRGSFFAQSISADNGHTPVTFDAFDHWDSIAGEPEPEDPCKSESQRLVHTSFTPTILDASAPSSTVVEYNARVTGPDTSLTLDTANSSIPMTDSDGDCVYTAQLTQGEALANYDPQRDVYRAIVGRQVGLGVSRNVLVDVHDQGLPSCSVEVHGDGVQSCPHLVNLVMPDSFSGNVDLAAVTRAFYQSFGDDYDFVNVVSELSIPQNREFIGTKNEVSGIGQRIFDDTATYGSAGRMRGIVFFPIPTLFDGASSTMSHELGHAWINWLSFPLLGQTVPHWPISTLAHGTMGYSSRNGQGLSFPFLLELDTSTGVVSKVSDPEPKRFTDLSLYLMGLLPASEVGEHFVMDSQDPNAFPSSEFTTFTIEDVIAADGARVPAAGSDQADFEIATILISREALSRQAMELYDFFAARAESKAETVSTHMGLAFETERPFFSSTGGRATLDATLIRP